MSWFIYRTLFSSFPQTLLRVMSEWHTEERARNLKSTWINIQSPLCQCTCCGTLGSWCHHGSLRFLLLCYKGEITSITSAELSNGRWDWHWAIIYSFSLPYNIPLYRLLSNLLLLDIWIVSNFWLLWIKVLWQTCLHMSFGGHKLNSLGCVPKNETAGSQDT